MKLKRLCRKFRFSSLGQRTDFSLSPKILEEYCDIGEAIRNAYYPKLRYKNDLYRNSFPVYIQMVSVAFHNGCRRILELGTGLSTILWGKYAHNTKAFVCTVDADLSNLRSLVQETPYEKMITDYVDCIQGKTITSDQLVDFYQGTDHQTFGDIDVVNFKEQLESFYRGRFNSRRFKAIEHITGKKGWRICDIFCDGNTLVFQVEILDIYSIGRSFKNEVAFLDDGSEDSRAGVLDQLLQRRDQWDFIFFDSGELASNVEWLKLKSSISVGGIAAFHDIFFPKSMKNFIICASLLVDSSWRPLYFNDTTPQGLFMFQRIR